MLDGLKEREPWSVSDERRFTKSVLNVPCCNARTKLGWVNADCQQCQTCRLVPIIPLHNNTHIQTILLGTASTVWLITDLNYRNWKICWTERNKQLQKDDYLTLQPLLHVPRTRTVYGSRAFSVAAPTLWNRLPADITNTTSLTVFGNSLNTLGVGEVDPVNNIILYIIILYIIYTYAAYGFPIRAASSSSISISRVYDVMTMNT